MNEIIAVFLTSIACILVGIDLCILLSKKQEGKNDRK